jgi:hypothetical protein
MEQLAAAWIDRELRGASRWLAFAIAAPPVLDRLDDAGWIGMLASGSFDVGEGGLTALGWSALFVALAIAAGQILRRHRPRARWWFYAACAAPMMGYFALTGFRVSAAIGALGLAVTALRLRAAGPQGTVSPQNAAARYADGPRDVLPPP